MKIGQTAILNTDDKGSARIKLELIDESKSGLFPADYWFSYPDAKSDRDKPIIHPDFGTSDFIKHELLLPEGMVDELISIGYIVIDGTKNSGSTLDFDYDNPSNGKTHGDLEATIADQLTRFTSALSGTTNPLEDFKTVVALGFNLWKLVGQRVCEDTSLIFSQVVREIDPNMVGQFQQVSNGCNNNDVCSYLYLCLPTLGNDYSFVRIKELCLETIDKATDAFDSVRHYTNSKSIDKDRIRNLYLTAIK